MNSQKSSKIIRVTLLGGKSVGKTCILNRLLGNDFQGDILSTIGIEKNYITIDHNIEGKVKVKIWDTSGDERFRSIAISTIRSSKGIIFVYDITDRKSFDEMTSLFYKTKKKSGRTRSENICGERRCKFLFSVCKI